MDPEVTDPNQESAGRFTPMAERSTPTVRYVPVQGLVPRTVPRPGDLFPEITTRYLPPDKIPAYTEFANGGQGEQVAICPRPQQRHSADLGPI